MKQTKLFGSDEEPKVLTSLDLEKATTIAVNIEELIKPICINLKIVGSIRRKKLTVGDCDFVVEATDSNWDKIHSILKKSKIICTGPIIIKLNIPFENDLFQVDFYRAYANNFGIQELIRTGSADHNMWLAGYAITKGFRLKYREGLLKDEQVVAGKTEESVFTALGLQCPKPEEREIINDNLIWLK